MVLNYILFGCSCYLAAMKSFTFQKRSKKVILHQRVIHADQKQCNRSKSICVYKISGKITFAQSKTFSSRAQSSRQRKKIHGTSSILAWGKSRVLSTDPLFTLIYSEVHSPIKTPEIICFMALTLQPIRGFLQHYGETGTRLKTASHRRLFCAFFLREGGPL